MPEPGRAPTDQISLRLPGDPAYGSIARTAAMALGLRAGFSWPVLQALALAVDETMVLLLGGRGSDGSLVLSFAVDDAHLQIEVRRDGADDGDTAPVDPEALQRFGELIEGAVTRWSVGTDTTTVRLAVER